jgi:hypothetical protein
VSEQAKVKGVVDIVFLIDVTGSMQVCIDALRVNIQTFIDTLTAVGPNGETPVRNWRGKVVGFRDYLVDAMPLVDNSFVEDAAKLKAQLAALVADGGGDEPESLLDALYVLATTPATSKGAPPDPGKWRHRSDAARVVVAFTDATFHEPMSQPRGGTLDDLFHACQQNRIILSLFAPEMDCHMRLSELDKCDYEPIPWDSSVPNGAQTALREFTTDRTKFARTMAALARSVSRSAEVEPL